jgi:sigma-B regulation protein RsbU (phosphoserine phosphatase)
LSTPVIHQYQRALESFRRGGREDREGVLLKRMSELISLLDLTATLGSSPAGVEILDAALLIVMGELQVGSGALLVRGEGGEYRPGALRGVRKLEALRPREPLPATPALRGEAGFDEPRGGPPFEVFCPISRGNRQVAILLLGPRAGGAPYGEDELAFLRSVAACAATPIESGLVYAELRDVNLRLSRKIFELHNLFDLSRELTSSFDESAIRSLFLGTVMGHLVVSRAALFFGGVEGLRPVEERGVRADAGNDAFVETEARRALEALVRPLAVEDLPPGRVRERLQSSRLAFVFPLTMGDRLEGFVAVGQRASRAPFTDEDHDFVRTLGRQALAALATVRLHRVELEKERQDRELQIAREIQRSLFPSELPRIAGWSLAAASEACFEVGGDHYDFIHLEDGRLAFAVADVSGKGTPASILMASVHASLRALAGASPPGALMTRLNRFLYESTQANKFVTLFFGELDPVKKRVRFVNAGHVPPYLLRAEGRVERLEVGGPAVGLLEEAAFPEGEVQMAPGDTLAIVTDGATEALSPGGEELDDAGVCQVLRAARADHAEGVLLALLDAVHGWTGPAGCSDDLTALVLKAEER